MMPSVQMLFAQVKPVLDKRLNSVIASEVPMMSNHLRLGGRCDLVCRFDGKKSILDFKTTNNEKTEDMMYGYFIQETLYSAMILECYGINAPQLVTISAGDSTPEAQVVIKHRDDYIKDAIKLVKTFYSLHYASD
jgi:ATP-dependent exoDNAse (exonuclease V) beta subunit